MTEYCYILDYNVGAIYEIELTEEESSTNVEIDDILDRRGLKSSECAWMFTSKKLSVEPIKLKDDESVSNK